MEFGLNANRTESTDCLYFRFYNVSQCPDIRWCSVLISYGLRDRTFTVPVYSGDWFTCGMMLAVSAVSSIRITGSGMWVTLTRNAVAQEALRCHVWPLVSCATRLHANTVKAGYCYFLRMEADRPFFCHFVFIYLFYYTWNQLIKQFTQWIGYKNGTTCAVVFVLEGRIFADFYAYSWPNREASVIMCGPVVGHKRDC